MIDVISLYQDVRDDANIDENGELGYEEYNRKVRRAELNLLKYLTGDLVPSNDFPQPFETQKNKDYLRKFIVPFSANGNFTVPEDYYYYDNLFKIGSFRATDCDDDDAVVDVDDCNTPIDILDGQEFYDRCHSYVEGLNPNNGGAPIAKVVDNKFIIQPADIGSVTLEYIRYPKYGFIKSVFDPQFNDQVADPATSQNLEWDEWAREPLIWFIVTKQAVSTREKAALENNLALKPRG